MVRAARFRDCDVAGYHGCMQFVAERAGHSSIAAIAAVTGLAIALWPSAALATYSICAVDTQTRQVGGAVTSCVGDLDVGVVFGSSPGHGVVHAQARLD